MLRYPWKNSKTRRIKKPTSLKRNPRPAGPIHETLRIAREMRRAAASELSSYASKETLAPPSRRRRKISGERRGRRRRGVDRRGRQRTRTRRTARALSDQRPPAERREGRGRDSPGPERGGITAASSLTLSLRLGGELSDRLSRQRTGGGGGVLETYTPQLL